CRRRIPRHHRRATNHECTGHDAARIARSVRRRSRDLILPLLERYVESLSVEDLNLFDHSAAVFDTQGDASTGTKLTAKKGKRDFLSSFADQGIATHTRRSIPGDAEQLYRRV